MSTEAKVTGHYTRGQLEETILRAVRQVGKNPEQLGVRDFAAMDEFHVGGIEATKALAAQMDLRPGLRLLDVGSGIGGPARYFAAEHGCQVMGIDLTEEFVQVAQSLTRLLNLDSQVEFQKANALALPFEAASFDGAYMLHVGMNIQDKAGICREVRRVLRPGALFTIFDIMRSAEGAMRFPVPWAQTEETSFVAEPETYRSALEQAGFSVERERARGAFAIEFTQLNMAQMAKNGPPVLGLQLLMGEQARAMIANTLGMMQAGLLQPVELFARAV